MALRTPTKGYPLGTHNSTMESQNVEGLRPKLSPKEHTVYQGYKGEVHKTSRGSRRLNRVQALELGFAAYSLGLGFRV